MSGVLGLFFGTGEDNKSRSNSDIMTAPAQGSKYVASIDQGTSSSRCIVFDRDGSIISEHQMEHEQFYPQPGRVEHDADEIWVSLVGGTSTSCPSVKLDGIVGILRTSDQRCFKGSLSLVCGYPLVVQ